MKKNVFEEFDVVQLVDDLAEGLPNGTKGVVQLVLGQSHDCYEVEFVDQFNNTIGIASVDGEKLVLIAKASASGKKGT